jgi:hypothetical protein
MDVADKRPNIWRNRGIFRDNPGRISMVASDVIALQGDVGVSW